MECRLEPAHVRCEGNLRLAQLILASWAAGQECPVHGERRHPAEPSFEKPRLELARRRSMLFKEGSAGCQTQPAGCRRSPPHSPSHLILLCDPLRPLRRCGKSSSESGGSRAGLAHSPQEWGGSIRRNCRPKFRGDHRGWPRRPRRAQGGRSAANAGEALAVGSNCGSRRS